MMQNIAPTFGMLLICTVIWFGFWIIKAFRMLFKPFTMPDFKGLKPDDDCQDKYIEQVDITEAVEYTILNNKEK